MGAYVYPVDNWQATDGSKYTGRRLRQMIGGLIAGRTAARPLGARSGVWPGTPASTVSASGTTLTVAPHNGAVDAQAPTSGPYLYSIDAPVALTVPAADASQDRVDLVVVQLSDPAEGDATSAPGVAVVYVPGAPGQGAPVTPARSLALARVSVLHGATTTAAVTWVATYTAAAGGIIPCRNAAEYPASPYLGQHIDDAQLGQMRWDGAQWDQQVPSDTGWLNLNMANGYTGSGQVRQIGDLVEFQGSVARTAGPYTSSSTTFATLPAAIGLPTINKRWATAGFSSNTRPNNMIVLLAAGSNALQAAGNASVATDINSTVYLDGVSYRTT